MRTKLTLVGLLLLALALVLVACSPAQPAPAEPQEQVTQEPCPTAAPAPECPECPEVPECPPEPVVQEVPFQDAWANSPHNAAEDEAFVHWDEDDPAEVPPSCAKCHSTPGYLDFLGADGTEAGSVDNPAPVGTTITCVACHNAVTATKSEVTFPSGVTVTGLGPSARCMECHQGRASTVQVLAAIEQQGLTDDADTANAELGFVNIHYYAAAATLFGGEVHGGFEFEGKSYEQKFMHVEGLDECTGCHNPHSTELRLDTCAVCHEGIGSAEDLRNVRMAGSVVDYDGDGDVEEGIFFEIETLQEMLVQAMSAYSSEVAGSPIIYEEHTHPYFFVDANENGEVDEGEAVRDNAYASWTANLLKAAYNYQTSLKDPGMYAHNGKYIIQILYDSIEVLNEQLAEPVDMAALQRDDPGHFAGGEEAWRHWDEPEEEGGEAFVPATCSKCHSADGLPLFIATGVTLPQEPSNGMKCSTCHNDVSTFTRFQMEQVQFPSGAVLGFEDTDPNLCLNCHQGREAKATLDALLNRVNAGEDEISDQLRFVNPHYFAAGATLFGTQAEGAYEFEGQEYNGRFLHVQAFDTCIECHNTHILNVRADSCTACHGSEDLHSYRNPAGDPTDYDGDGDTAEGLAGEVETMEELLFEALQQHAADIGADTIAYNPNRYPYFFTEAGEQFRTWSPSLLRAAYNYQWVQKDPGAFAHNGMYIMQILYDSLQSLGADVSGMTRPPVEAVPETPAE